MIKEEFIERLITEAKPIALQIVQNNNGISVYGSFLDKAIGYHINAQECNTLKEDALESLITHKVLSIKHDIIRATCM